MGWIPPAQIIAWFDLNGIDRINRSWYYRCIMSVEAGYLAAKREAAQQER